MKHNLFLLVFFIITSLFFFSCGISEELKETPVEALKTFEDQKKFLLDIFEKDQFYRQRSGEIISQYGYKSPEHIQNDSFGKLQDEINLEAIEEYLNYYGYPDKDTFGELAAYTPWTVVHHAESYEVREQYFPLFYQAYYDENIDEGAMAMYLERMYRIRFREEPVYTSNGENTRIEQLRIMLNLRY